MKITRNLRAMSKLSLTLLLLVDFIVGAVISYMFAMGYIVSIGLQLPEKPSITIANVTFSPQNATTFNVTILNPSYSPSTAIITQILAITEDGDSYTAAILYPLSREIKPGNLENFTCSWDWSSYAGETVTVHALVEGGSGATSQAKTPSMEFRITDVYFNSTVSTTQFNFTLQNSELSATYVKITNITVTMENGTIQPIIWTTPPIFYTLEQGSSVTFMCLWNWTNYRSKNLTITVRTLQGYMDSREVATPERVILKVKEAIFNVTDTSHFNVTVQNSELSSIHVNVINISVTTHTIEEITIQNVTPPLPYSLLPDSQVEFKCLWNWTDYQGENVTIALHTLLGYSASYNYTIPPAVNLTITKVLFDAHYTDHFNVTVKNPELSPTYVNITKITITLEDGVPRNINQTGPTLTPPYSLPKNTSATFKCTWNWTDYRDKNVTITVYTLQDYMAHKPEVTPSPVNLTITEVRFDIANKTQLNVTVKNSESSPISSNITKITATLENGTTFEIMGVTPHILDRNSSFTFNCQWNWTLYRGKKVLITAYHLQGYPANYAQVTPQPVILNITAIIFFNVTDIYYFNITVKNMNHSLTYDVITQVTVALNETIIETIEVTPPVFLYPNDFYTFMFSWDWAGYQGQSLTITVYSIRGYTASTQKTP